MNRVIIAGGDGSVMWVVDELIKNDIDLKRCACGIIPFGTGNDFSITLGWGDKCPKNLISGLHNIAF